MSGLPVSSRASRLWPKHDVPSGSSPSRTFRASADDLVGIAAVVLLLPQLALRVPVLVEALGPYRGRADVERKHGRPRGESTLVGQWQSSSPPTSARSSPAPCSSTASPSASSGATASRSPGRTAPARRRCSASSRARPRSTAASWRSQKGTRVALHDQRPPLERDITLREYVISGAGDLDPARGGARGARAGDGGRRARPGDDEPVRRSAGTARARRRLRVAGPRHCRPARARVRGRSISTGSCGRSPAAS